jgi:hypothetical protein
MGAGADYKHSQTYLADSAGVRSCGEASSAIQGFETGFGNININLIS